MEGRCHVNDERPLASSRAGRDRRVPHDANDAGCLTARTSLPRQARELGSLVTRIAHPLFAVAGAKYESSERAGRP